VTCLVKMVVTCGTKNLERTVGLFPTKTLTAAAMYPNVEGCWVLYDQRRRQQIEW
jgi:hypothetical protein